MPLSYCAPFMAALVLTFTAPFRVDAQTPEPQPDSTPPKHVALRGTVVVPLVDPGIPNTTVPVVDVMVNGRGPFRFGVETGANFVALSPDFAAKANLRSAGTTADLPAFRIDSITLGGASFHDVRAAALPRGGTGVDGLLGLPFFHDVLLTIDYAARQLRISRDTLRAPDGDSILQFTHAGPFWGVPIDFAGVPLVGVLDTRGTGIRPLPPGFPTGPIIGDNVLRNFVVSLDQRHGRLRLERAGSRSIELSRPVPNAATAAQGAPPGVDSLAGYVGEYGDREITLTAGKLYLQRPGGPQLEMRQTGRDAFGLVAVAEARIEFTRDGSGKVNAIRVFRSGAWEEVPRSTGQLPSCSPPGAVLDRVLRQIVSAVNVGTYQSIEQFIDEHWDASRLPPDRRDALRTMLGRWHWQSTTLQPVRQCGTDETAYAVLANAQTGELDSLHVTITAGGSIVRQMRLVQGSTVPVAASDTSSDSARAVALGNLVHRMAEAGTFSGEVLLAHNGHIVYHEAAGVADRSTGRKAAVGDGYSIASVGKLITATAIMQLVEQGRLSLDDTLGKFLAAGDRPGGAARVPIKTILSHTDGMTNGSDSLAFEPGTRFAYVNYGYYLLGRVIEKVTGKPFAEHLATSIFAPAGMTSTRRLVVSEPDPRLPPAYDVGFDSSGIRLAVNPLVQTTPATGAGGLFSTALDLFRFAESLRAGHLVSEATLRVMRTPRRELGAADYGYGVDLFRGNNVWGHSGALPGAEAELELYGDSGYVFVLLSNVVTGDPIRRRVNALVR